MSLDQDLAVATDIHAVFLDPGQRRAELRADILAIAAGGGTDFDRSAYPTRPALLRRMASLLAESLPSDAERLISAEAPGGIALTTALALHTGLPFAILRERTSSFLGDVYRGEHAVVIAPIVNSGEGATRVIECVRAAGAEVAAVLAVVAPGRGAATAVAATGSALHALFSTDWPR